MMYLVYATMGLARADSVLAGLNLGLGAGATDCYDQPRERLDGKWVFAKPPAELMTGLTPEAEEVEDPETWWTEMPS